MSEFNPTKAKKALAKEELERRRAEYAKKGKGDKDGGKGKGKGKKPKGKGGRNRSNTSGSGTESSGGYTSGATVTEDDKKRMATQPCPWLAKGKCHFGDRCWYSHE